MLNRYSTIFITIIFLLTTGCAQTPILPPTKDRVAVSPYSIAVGGEKMSFSDLEIEELGVASNMSTDEIFEYFDLSSDLYSLEELKTVLRNLDTKFEQRFLSFHRSVVKPATKSGSTVTNPEVRERTVRIVRNLFRPEIDDFLNKFGDKDSVMYFEESLSVPSYYGGSQSGDSGVIESRQEIFFFLDKIQKLASKVQKAKDIIREWLESRMRNFIFKKNLRITIEVASQTGNPLITARRAFASIKGANKSTQKFSLIETKRQCRSKLLACRIEFVHVLNENTASEVEELYEVLRSFEKQKQVEADTVEPVEKEIRNSIDSLTFNMELLINGHRAHLKLPGSFMEISSLN